MSPELSQHGVAARSSQTKDPLLQPLQIKGITLRNRLMMASHALRLVDRGLVTERYIRYLEERAKGGLGLICFGGSSNVSLDSPNVVGQFSVRSDEVIPGFRELSERLHRHGAAAICQISHFGRRSEYAVDKRLPAIGPSRLREPRHRSIPKEMDELDIARVIRDYGEAARRCRDGGLDGIETLASGHLIGQFLSPITNRRTDKFGGSLENRARFMRMVHEEIRRAVDDDFVVGIRFTIDEGVPEGLSDEEAIAAAKLLANDGLVDFFDAVYGRVDTFLRSTLGGLPAMDSPIAPWLDHVGRFKQAVGLPVFHSARVADIATARHALRNNLVDVVGMTRPHMADPHIVSKVIAGEEERIRPCVGATHCHFARGDCIHNPASGNEIELPHVAERSAKAGRKVVVIGGGPAGLEVARVACERGHDVSVFEAGNSFGGQIGIAALHGWRRDLIGIIDWRVAELERMGAALHLNRWMEVEDVQALGPDVVIVATGGIPDLEWLSGSELCVTTWDILSRSVPVAAKTIVVDGTGRQPALQAAELAGESSQVDYFCIDGDIAAEASNGERPAWKRKLYSLPISFHFDQQLVSVERREGRLLARFRSLATEAIHEVITDQVIVEGGTMPVDDLYQALRPFSSNAGFTDLGALLAGTPQPIPADASGFELHRIGDAVASRDISSSILDALRLGRAL